MAIVKSVFNLACYPCTNIEYKQISSVWFEDHFLHVLAFGDVFFLSMNGEIWPMNNRKKCKCISL